MLPHTSIHHPYTHTRSSINQFIKILLWTCYGFYVQDVWISNSSLIGLVAAAAALLLKVRSRMPARASHVCFFSGPVHRHRRYLLWPASPSPSPIQSIHTTNRPCTLTRPHHPLPLPPPNPHHPSPCPFAAQAAAVSVARIVRRRCCPW